MSMSEAAALRAQAKRYNFRGQAFIGGKFVDAADGDTLDCISPIDGKLLARIASCKAEDVDRAVSAARAAFASGVWASALPADRKRALFRFADAIETHGDELALLETLDMGKPIALAKRVDIASVVRTVRWYAEAIDKIYGEIAPTGPDALGLITREPLGVVAAVVPWNFPLMIAAWKFAPALAVGNSVVLKPAEQSPLTAIRVAELAAEAGIPDGVFNVVPGLGHKAGQAIGLHMDVDAVAFTGSTEVGKLFLQYAGQSNMKSTSLECGGKSPNIVFADAPDLDAAAQSAASSIFFNSGQVCVAGSRLLVEESIRDDLVERLLDAAKAYEPNDPLDPETLMGSMVDEGQTDRVLGYVKQGLEDGGSLIAGGGQVRKESGGFYVEPTIFDNVTNEMAIAREEIFGPVLSVITFRGLEEAVQIANDTIYGLEASLWTRDLTRAHKVAKALRVGTVNVNNTDGGGIELPFGGCKQSGFGRDKSLHSLEKYTTTKSTYISLR